VSQTKAQLLDGSVVSVAFSAGSAAAPSLYFTGDTNTGIYSPGADQVAISTGGSGRLFVDQLGRVGIGATPSGARLEVRGGSGPYMYIVDSGANGGAFVAEATNSVVNVGSTYLGASAVPLALVTGGTERLRITSTGLVGIGTTAPSSLLHLVSSGQPTITVADDAGRTLQVKAPDSSANPGFVGTTTNHDLLLQAGISAGGLNVMRFNTAGTERARIDSSGRVGIGTTSPLTKLEVRSGVITAGSVDAPNGAEILRGYYGSSGALAVIGSEYSSGGTVIGYAVKPSTSASDAFLSSASGTLTRGAYTIAGNIHKWYIGANQTVAENSSVSTSEVMRIDSSGRVGIGTSSPSSALDVRGEIRGGNGTIIGGISYSTRPEIGSISNHNLGFITNNTTQMLLDTSGRLGIGTTSPLKELQINATTPTIRLEENSAGSKRLEISIDSSALARIDATQSGSQLLFGTVGTERARIDSSGRVGIGVTSITGTNTKLEVGGAGPTEIKISDTSTYNAQFRGFRLGITGDSQDYSGIRFQPNSGELRTEAGFATWGGFQTFYTNGLERARIDSSGRLLVGTSTARTDYFNNTLTAMLQIEGINSSGAVDRACVSIVNNNNLTVNESPVLVFGRSNGSTVNSKTLVSNGTRCGYISFQGADGSDLVDAASIAGEIDGTPSANDMPGRLVFSTTADGSASPTERMRIGSAGQTDVFSSAGGIVSRSAAAAGTSVSTFVGIHSASSTGNGTNSFIVWSNGNVVNTNNSYGAISDVKLKENIVDANSQWDDLKSLQVRNYNFKEGQTHTQIGLVAQEVELVSPGLVSESPDRNSEGHDLGTVTKSVNYSVLYMKAIKALQEAMNRIETLEQRLTDAGIE
jgi:hypothetical protein